MTEYELWMEVARRIEGVEKPREKWGLCYFLNIVAFSNHLSEEEYFQQEQRMKAYMPVGGANEGPLGMYWFPLNTEGDRKRIEICHKLAGRAQ